MITPAPKFNSALGVFDFTAASGNLYALGDFTTVNGDSHPHIARFVLKRPSFWLSPARLA
ncbi:MAG: hypothetical protein ACR2GB_06305 [Nocardioidaceae bacterium]